MNDITKQQLEELGCTYCHEITEGWWTDLNDNKITTAYFGDTVRFHIKTKAVSDGEKVDLTIYDDDGWNDTQVGSKSKQITIIDSTGFVEININKNWETMVDSWKETGGDIELYTKATYKTVKKNLPSNKSNYLRTTENNLCGEKPPMPMSPSYGMGNVFWNSYGETDDIDARQAKESQKKLQDAINYLTCRAKHLHPLKDDEKEFLKELYEAMWWGGKIKGYSEAAQLANHYVNGGGQEVRLDSEVYETSLIVTEVTHAMIKHLQNNNKIKDSNSSSAYVFMSNNADFVKNSNVKKLLRGYRSSNDGYINPADGYVILTEQKNLRLKYTDNRFFIKSTSIVNGSNVTTTFRTEAPYDFQPFDSSSTKMTPSDSKNITGLPLGGGYELMLPDGLSDYMVSQKVANKFNYYAEWSRTWKMK
jgi:hypothetical protein